MEKQKESLIPVSRKLVSGIKTKKLSLFIVFILESGGLGTHPKTPFFFPEREFRRCVQFFARFYLMKTGN